MTMTNDPKPQTTIRAEYDHAYRATHKAKMKAYNRRYYLEKTKVKRAAKNLTKSP
jgi:hypothetical protein